MSCVGLFGQPQVRVCAENVFCEGGDSSEIDDLTEEWRARLWPGRLSKRLARHQYKNCSVQVFLTSRNPIISASVSYPASMLVA